MSAFGDKANIGIGGLRCPLNDRSMVYFRPSLTATIHQYHPLLASLADSEGFPQGRLTARSHRAPLCGHQASQASISVAVAEALEAPAGLI
jgi:hypothetical protein